MLSDKSLLKLVELSAVGVEQYLAHECCVTIPKVRLHLPDDFLDAISLRILCYVVDCFHSRSQELSTVCWAKAFTVWWPYLPSFTFCDPQDNDSISHDADKQNTFCKRLMVPRFCHNPINLSHLGMLCHSFSLAKYCVTATVYPTSKRPPPRSSRPLQLTV